MEILVKSAVLAEAFRGELIPTEAGLAQREGRNYEPASILPECIRAKRADLVPTRSPKRKLRKTSAHV